MRRSRRVAWVAAALALAGCGKDGGGGATTSTAAGGGVLDACALVSKADLEAILGAGTATHPRASGAVSVCAFQGPKASVTVQVATASRLAASGSRQTVVEWADAIQSALVSGRAASAASSVTPVEGLGDRASWVVPKGAVLGHLIVVRGDACVTASTLVRDADVAKALVAKILAGL